MRPPRLRAGARSFRVSIIIDLMGDGGDLRNEIAGRFEQYSADYTLLTTPGFKVDREYPYAGKRKGVGYDSPDILIEEAGELAIVIECKATKLTFSAKFSDDPAADAEGAIRGDWPRHLPALALLRPLPPRPDRPHFDRRRQASC